MKTSVQDIKKTFWQEVIGPPFLDLGTAVGSVQAFSQI